MYYILYEGLKIESNEPVYCTLYNIHCTLYSVQCIVYKLTLSLFINEIISFQFLNIPL